MPQNLKVRAYNPDDAHDSIEYQRLNSEADFAHLLSRPGYSVGEALFFAEVDGAVVGYVNVLPELGIGRVVLDYRVSYAFSPEFVLKGLLVHALERAGRMGAKVAHLSARSSEKMPAELLSALGFSRVRCYYEMSLVLSSKVDFDTAEQPSFAYRHLQPGEEGRLASIQNRCFGGSWGYNSNTTEDVLWQFDVRGNSLRDIILALDKEEVIGYCWTVPNGDHDASSGKSRGRIYMLGVRPDCRNRGVGRKLLEMGLSHLQNEGREIVDITVDSQNVAAITIYDSLGFRLCDETVWYERILDAPQMGGR